MQKCYNFLTPGRTAGDFKNSPAAAQFPSVLVNAMTMIIEHFGPDSLHIFESEGSGGAQDVWLEHRDYEGLIRALRDFSEEGSEGRKCVAALEGELIARQNLACIENGSPGFFDANKEDGTLKIGKRCWARSGSVQKRRGRGGGWQNMIDENSTHSMPLLNYAMWSFLKWCEDVSALRGRAEKEVQFLNKLTTFEVGRIQHLNERLEANCFNCMLHLSDVIAYFAFHIVGLTRILSK